MAPKKYLISYEWAAGRDGSFFWHRHFETDSFIVMMVMFLKLKLRYGAISIDYRRM